MLGDDLDTPFALALRRPVVPEILGFDPRVQFVHEDDVVGALMYATTNDVPGVYNVAGDGNMPWSEVCAMVGKPRVPLSPWLTNIAAEPLRFLRLWDLPPEALQLLALRPSLDNTAIQARRVPLPVLQRGHGRSVRRGLRLAKTIGDKHPTYRYEREVEDFFRHSPAVIRHD